MENLITQENLAEWKEKLTVKNLFFSYYDQATDTQELEFTIEGVTLLVRNVKLDEEDNADDPDLFDDEIVVKKIIDRAVLGDIEVR